jgi:hypothetical protein
MAQNSFPTQDDFAIIAARDPRLAWGIATGQGKQLQVFSGFVTFVDGTVDKFQGVNFEQIPEMVYVSDFSYEVETPNANQGSIFQGQQQLSNAKVPNIHLRLQVSQGNGPSNYVVNTQDMPIQQIARHATSAEGGICSWANGWLLHSWQSLQARCTLKRTYLPGELPVTVTFALRCSYLGAPYNEIVMEQALNGLESMGLKLDRHRQALAIADQFRLGHR